MEVIVLVDNEIKTFGSSWWEEIYDDQNVNEMSKYFYLAASDEVYK